MPAIEGDPVQNVQTDRGGYNRPADAPLDAQTLFAEAVMHAVGSATFVNRMAVHRIDEDQYVLAVGTLLGANLKQIEGAEPSNYAKVHGAYIMKRHELQTLTNLLAEQFNIKPRLDNEEEGEIGG